MGIYNEQTIGGLTHTHDIWHASLDTVGGYHSVNINITSLKKDIIWS